MIALLAPRSNRIAVKEVDGWSVLCADGSQEFRSDHELESDHGFRDDGDTQVVDVDSLTQAGEELAAALAEMDALDLLLLSLDSTLTDDTRQSCLEELNPLLANSRVVDSLNCVMSAKPLPASSDINGAIEYSLNAMLNDTSRYLKQLKALQPAITRVREGWSELSDDLFESHSERHRFEGACLQIGLFHDLSHAVCHSSLLGELIYSSLSKLAPFRLARASTVLHHWSRNSVRRFTPALDTNVLKKEREELIVEFWQQVEVGQQYTGTVKAIKDYGAFIDLGGADGFLNISEMSWTRIKHPSDLLQAGDSTEVVVLSLDRKTQKILLGMRQLATNPWAGVEVRYPTGKKVSGKVTRVLDFGAFVELEAGVEGLIHISELDHQRVRKVSDVVNVGQEVEMQVLEVLPDQRRISLSLKALLQQSEKPKSEDTVPPQEQQSKRKQKGPLRGETLREGGGG